MTPRYIIIHTAAFEGKASIDDVRRWHLERGFNDIGYHYYIRRDGGIQSGRGETTPGAHCVDMGMNQKSLGICFEGHGDKEPFTQKQRNALCSLYAVLHDSWGITPGSVLGHRETGANKTCPGTQVDMKDLRDMLRMELRFLPERRGDEIERDTIPPRTIDTDERKPPSDFTNPVSYSNTLAEFVRSLEAKFRRRQIARLIFNGAISILSTRVPELNHLKLNIMTTKKGWLERKLEEKSTYVGALITVAVLVLGYFGYNVGVAELTTHVEALVIAVSAVIIAAGGLYDLFRDEPEEE
jgi:hypothetical protein